MDFRRAGQAGGPFGDVDRHVGHALQLPGDFHDRRDAPQVVGHRLVQRQNLQAFFLNAHVPAVDLVVAVDDFLRDVDVGPPQLVDGPVDDVFDDCAHRHDVLVQRFQIAGEMNRHAGPCVAAVSRVSRTGR